MAVFFDDEKSRISVRELPAFPRCRYDCNGFILEEALIGGNYCLVNVSAQGMSSSRDRIMKFVETFRADKSRFSSFELRINGQILKDRFVFGSQVLTKTIDDFDKHEVELLYAEHGVDVKVKVCTLLDGSDFLVRWLEICNTGTKELTVTGLFPLAGILYPEIKGNTFKAEHLRPCPEVGTFKDNYYLGEGEFEWLELPKATLKFSHERALFGPPVYFVSNSCGGGGGITMISIETGLMTQAEFTKCGDYYYSRHVSNDDHVHFKTGQDERSTEYIIPPGGSSVSPKIHISQLYKDMDGCANSYYRHLRRSVIPPRQQRIRYPVEYNHTSFSSNCQINPDFLMNEVDMAVLAGAELFVVDAGWFGPAHREWSQNRGDWFENELLGSRLRDVFDYARSKGLMCGMWMEAEGMDFGTVLAKEHPDWFIHAYNRELPIVDIRIPEAFTYVRDCVAGMIRRYSLDLFRIDGGLKEPAETIPGSKGGYPDYYDRLYEIFVWLRNEFPDLYFENCSGGGGRSDLAIMRYFDWMQATDNFAPIAQLRTIYNLSMAFPIEQLMSVTGSFMEHQTDPDLMARSCIFGRPQISGIADGSLRANPVLLGAWSRAVDLYKNVIRPILPDCSVYHHTLPENYMEHGRYLVLEIASAGRDVSAAGLFRLEGADDGSSNSRVVSGDTGSYVFMPRGLSVSCEYEVYFDNSGDKIRLSGYDLINRGVRVVFTGKPCSEIIVIKKV